MRAGPGAQAGEGALAGPLGGALALLLPLLPAYAVAPDLPGGEALVRLLNRAGPVWFIGVLGFTCLRLVRRSPETIWTPVFWLPAQSALFFGLGPLVEVFGTAGTRRALAAEPLALGPEELLWANLLATAGVWCLLLGLALHLRLAGGAWRRAATGRTGLRPVLPAGLVAILFVGLGAALKYGLTLPAEWGLIAVVVPGAITTITPIVDVGFAIMAFLAARGRRWMLVVFLLAWPAHVALSALTFSKTHLMLALLLPALGHFLARRRLASLAGFVAASGMVFAAAQPFVHHARDEIRARTGAIAEAGYSERARIALAYLADPPARERARADRQGWWTRLNYAPVQVAARTLRESGVENPSMQDLWLHFVPRLLWPEKPIPANPGAVFYHMLTGREGSFLGLSIHGDLYWHGGWWALCLGTLATGWMFAMMSLRSIRILGARDFIRLPLVLLALQAAVLGPTDFMANGIIALVPMYLAYALLVGGAATVLGALPRRGPARGARAAGRGAAPAWA